MSIPSDVICSQVYSPPNKPCNGQDSKQPQHYIRQVYPCLLPPSQFRWHLHGNFDGVGDAVSLRYVGSVMRDVVPVSRVPPLNPHRITLLLLDDAVMDVYAVPLVFGNNERVRVLGWDGDVLHRLASSQTQHHRRNRGEGEKSS